MKRRDFISFASLCCAGFSLDPGRLLWTPPLVTTNGAYAWHLDTDNMLWLSLGAPGHWTHVAMDSHAALHVNGVRVTDRRLLAAIEAQL